MRTTKLRSIIASLAQTALAMPALLVAGMLTGANTYGGTTTLNGGTLSLANYYSENELAIAGDSAINAALNFPSIWDGPLTGSSTLTLTGYYGGQLSFVYNGAGNTFTGNIIVDSGTLRISVSPFATTTGGFTAPSMTSSDTITINRAGTLYIDDNVANGYTANRFGSDGNRPAVTLAGGRIDLNGRNNASSSVQTLGALTVSSGQGTITVTRNTAGTPTLTFDSLSISKGATVFFNGTSLGTSSKITFASAPTLTGGIIAGAQWWDGGNANNNLVTYGVNGVSQFWAYTDVSTDINGVAADANVRATNTTTAAAALTADQTVNSLTINHGSWNMTKKLTITSGMFNRKGGANALVNITSGTLTAGNGIDDIDLHIINTVQATTFSGTSVIADNAATAVTLVKTGTSGRELRLESTINNTYTGGTYVLDGTVVTGTTANKTYLGTGKVTVDGGGAGSPSTLTLGAIGATSSAASDDFTAINGGKITLSSNNHGSVDTFNIGANSIIYGDSGSGTGLASLTRGTSITLAAGAIVSHKALTAALILTTGTIQNLGSSADLYYGLNASQTNASGAVTIGSGTAFRGISTERSAQSWQLGTINIATGTTSVDFQGHGWNAAPLVLTLGNGATAGAPVISFVSGTGTVDIKAIGALTINDSTATFGNTGSGQNIRFVATAGSTLTVTAADGMGSGSGIASALVENGGSLAIGNTTALNGAVTVESGGRLTANQASGLTGAGALTFEQGSIINITSVTGFSGAQATAATVNAGTIVRLGVVSFGAVGETLDSYLSTKSPIYQVTGNFAAANPTAADTTILTLNKNGSGVGGMLINDSTSRTMAALSNGKITLGANGGVIAATTNTTFNVQENITGAGTLTIGTTAIIDGAPKTGLVNIDIAANSNTYTGGTIINAGTAKMANDNVLGATTNQLTVNTDGTLNMNNKNLTVGNLTGTGGVISIGGAVTLTIGQGDFGGGNYQGSIQGASGKLTKTGTGTITLSGTNTYTGVSTISGGMLQFAKQISLYNNTPGSWTKGNIVVNSGGTLALNVGGTGEFTAGNVTTLLGNLTANISNNGLRSGAAVAFDTSNASPATFTLASAIANSSGTGSGAIGVKKLGANTLVLAGTNTYTGGTTVNAGTLQVASINALPGFNVASRVSVSSSATLAVQAGGVGEWSSGDIDSLLGATPAAFASGSTFGIVVSTNNSFSYANNIGATQEDKSFVKSGDGTLTLSGANTYTGTTTINGGTLVLGADSTLPAAGAVILSGGTINGGSYSNAVGALTITGTNTIALGTGTLRFADSAGATWTGSLVLTGALGANSIQFGTNSVGLGQTQLARITINGNEVFINGSGYIAMVPGGTVFRFW